MKYVKLFEDFEAYNEFGLEDPQNIDLAKKALNDAEISFDLTSGSGITFFIFHTADDLNSATEIVQNLIDTKKEPDWPESTDEI